MSAGNNLDTPYGSINIYLQSRDAQVSYSDGNKVWYLNTPVIPPRPDIRMLCAITDFQCAYSWYLVRTGVNDTFVFSMTQAGVTTIYTCVLPEGNYNVNTFMSTMHAISFPAAGVPIVSPGDDTKFTYDVKTNKLSLSNSSATTTAITVFSRANGTTIDGEVGMEGFPNQTGILPATVVLPNMVDFAGIPNVYVMATTLGLNNRDGRGEVNLCLGKVPVICQPLGFIYLPIGQFVYLMLDDREIKKIQIKLEDDEGNVLDLHGVGWSITLSIHYQYQRFPTKQSLTLESGKEATTSNKAEGEPKMTQANPDTVKAEYIPSSVKLQREASDTPLGPKTKDVKRE